MIISKTGIITFQFNRKIEMTDIKIRQLHSNDVHDFRTIRLSALKNNPEMFASSYAIEVKKPLAVFQNVITTHTIFAAYHQHKIVAMLILQQNNDSNMIHQANLYGFFVEPDFRKQGIAKQLLKTAIAYGQTDLKCIMLSVMVDNIAAIQLYKTLGFKPHSNELKILNSNHYPSEISMIFNY